MHRTQIMSDGQERQTCKQLTLLIAKKGFQTNGKRKNNLRIFQAESRGIFKNSQLQIIFTGCYKKRVYQEIVLLRKDQYNQCIARFRICNN